MTGEVGILNIGAGDTKIVFDKDNPADMARAARIVTDMIKRGYALLVEIEPGKYQRALEFREDRCEYVIADFDPTVAEVASEQEATPEARSKRTPRGRGSRRIIPAGEVRAVAVARSAGG